MLRSIRFTAVLACSAILTGCAADTTPPNQAPSTDAEQSTTEPQLFMLHLDGTMTAKTAIPLILAASHDQLAAACDSVPGASVRILNPLASGDYLDLPCSVILNGTGETNITLTSEPFEGPIGHAEQKLGPITFLMCGIFLGSSSLFLAKVLCPRARTAQNRAHCDDLNLGGTIALGLLCSIPL